MDDKDKKLEEGQGTQDQNDAGATGGSEQNNGGKDNAGSTTLEKTFTQDDVNRMMTREKKQGANSVYNDLGINPKDSKMIDDIKQYIASKKTDVQKEAEKMQADNAALLEANRKTMIAEAKAEAMMLGVQKQFVEDAVTLVLGKVENEDGTDIKTALGELKTKYPVWFEDGKDEKDDKSKVGQKGTGSSVKSTSKDKGSDEKNLGARLAANRKASAKKSSYWDKK